MKKPLAVAVLTVLAFAAFTVSVLAASLYSEDFNDSKLKGFGEVYTQGTGDLGQPFYVEDSILRGGNSDAYQEPFMFITGDLKWTDISLTTKVMVKNQGTGAMGWIIRAKDSKNCYVLRYATNNQALNPDEEDSGIAAPANNPDLRILKVVNGKYSILSQTGNAKVPAINKGSDYEEEWVYFRFTAVGDVLTAYFSPDGKAFTKLLEAKDGTFKAGKIGLDHYGYDPYYDDLVVATAK